MDVQTVRYLPDVLRLYSGMPVLDLWQWRLRAGYQGTSRVRTQARAYGGNE